MSSFSLWVHPYIHINHNMVIIICHVNIEKVHEGLWIISVVRHGSGKAIGSTQKSRVRVPLVVFQPQTRGLFFWCLTRLTDTACDLWKWGLSSCRCPSAPSLSKAGTWLLHTNEGQKINRGERNVFFGAAWLRRWLKLVWSPVPPENIQVTRRKSVNPLILLKSSYSIHMSVQRSSVSWNYAK